MQITSFSIYRYKLPLSNPIRFPMRMLYRREGLLLRLDSDTGAVGWGEAAPLPGFSREHLQEATRQAFQLKRIMTGRTIDAEGTNPEEALGRDLDELEVPASVRFGFEMGMWYLWAAERETTLPEAITSAPKKTLHVNGLLSGEQEEVLKQARHLQQEGYQAIKLKVGQQAVQKDIEMVKAVRNVLGEEIKLWLDANQAWDRDEAETFAEGVADAGIAYIEEPLYDPSELKDFAASSPLPVALDESLLDIPSEELEAHTYAHAVVLKPTVLGGFTHALHLARQARALGITPVISGAYEAGIGTLGLVALAACLDNGDETPIGLSTYHWLKEDVLRPRLKMDGGRINVPPMMGAKRTMNGHLLREV